MNLSEEQRLNFDVQNYTKILKPCIKMEKSITKFADIDIEKQKFQRHKKLFQ